MISEELLSEVLGIEVVANSEISIKYNNIEYNEKRYSFNVWEDINIHELDYKCKEWANQQGFVLDIQYSKDYCGIRAYKELYDTKPLHAIHTNKYEPSDCFKACQWILDNG